MFSILYFLGKLFTHEVNHAKAAEYASRPEVRAKYMGEDMLTKVRKSTEQWKQRAADEQGLTVEQFNMFLYDQDWERKEKERVEHIIYDRPWDMYTSFEKVEKKAEWTRAMDEIHIKASFGAFDRYKKYDSTWTPEMRQEDAWRMYEELQQREREQAKERGLIK